MASSDTRPTRLTVLYDERCRFCTSVAAWLVRHSAGTVAAAPIGSALGGRALRDVAPERRYDAVHVVDECGRRRSGAGALPALLGTVHGLGWAAWAAKAFPGLTDAGYAFVTRHRGALSRLWLRPASRGRAG